MNEEVTETGGDLDDLPDDLKGEVPVSTQLLFGATAGAVTWQVLEIGPTWALASVTIWWILAITTPALVPYLARSFVRYMSDSGETPKPKA
jgi:hypothetical protein